MISLETCGVLFLSLLKHLPADFIYYVLYVILLMLHSAPPLFEDLLNADTSPIYLYIVIVNYKYKIYLMNFIHFYCTAT